MPKHAAIADCDPKSAAQGSLTSRVLAPKPETPHVATIATTDVDEQASLLRGWNQTYSQLSAGRFSGHLINVDLDGFTIFREVTANSLHQTGALPNDLVAIGVPVHMQGAATFCGHTCNGSQLHIFSGEDGFEFHSPSGLDIAGIVLAKDQLLSSCSERERDGLERDLAQAHLYASSVAIAVRLRSALGAAIEALTAAPEIFSRADLLAAFKQDLTGVISDVLNDDRTNEAVFLSSERRLQIVRDARHTVLNNNDAPITVEDLCRVLGVSRRTLQYCFQEAFGMRPTQYLRAVRLNGARRDLKHGLSVTDAATKWGFWHFGRFAQEYKALFEETPSVTKQRHRLG